MALIEVENLSKTYRGRSAPALDRVSLSIEAGESVGIIGPNGAGKTTLLSCLLGFLHPNEGRVTIDGLAPDDLSVRARTGYLPERLVFDRWMNGLEFLRFHHALANLPAAQREADCAAALERVGLAAAAGTQPIGRYSRGMLQRIGLAQALLGDPRFLFLDEPVSGVDPTGLLVFRKLLADLSRQGVTIVLNSHQLSEVERVCSRVVFVKQGRIEAVDTTHAGAAVARVLRVRLAASVAAPTPVRLAELAQGAGASYIEWVAPDARFAVTDDTGATRLLAALLAGSIAVIEAAPEQGRLERFFASEAAQSAGAPAPGHAPVHAPGHAPGPAPGGSHA